MSNDHTLGLSSVTATIHPPIEKVDIPDCLFNLPDALSKPIDIGKTSGNMILLVTHFL